MPSRRKPAADARPGITTPSTSRSPLFRPSQRGSRLRPSRPTWVPWLWPEVLVCVKWSPICRSTRSERLMTQLWHVVSSRETWLSRRARSPSATSPSTRRCASTPLGPTGPRSRAGRVHHLLRRRCSRYRIADPGQRPMAGLSARCRARGSGRIGAQSDRCRPRGRAGHRARGRHEIAVQPVRTANDRAPREGFGSSTYRLGGRLMGTCQMLLPGQSRFARSLATPRCLRFPLRSGTRLARDGLPGGRVRCCKR